MRCLTIINLIGECTHSVCHVVVVDHECTYEYVNIHHYLSRQLNYGLSQLYGNLYHK